MTSPLQKSLTDKVALVTGGSRGIGRAIARRLAAEGALVAVHYGSRREAAEETVSLIEQEGGQAFALGARLEDTAALPGLLATLDQHLLERRGKTSLNILINNAGITPRNRLEDVREAEVDEVFALNVKAPFFLIQQVVSRMSAGDRIINVSSGATRIALPDIVAYAMTKGAINTLTLTLAKELGPRGITVNAVLPGIVDTDMNAGWLHDAEAWAGAASLSVLGRVGQPTDVAEVVAFLASEASRWITGQCLDVTGGSQL